MSRFQVVGQKLLDRAGRHVWCKLADGRKLFKCVLCGALAKKPPNFEQEEDWVPERYEPLTDEERRLCPNPNNVYG